MMQKLEYKPQTDSAATAGEVKMKPRIIIHGGAGNISLTMPPAKYQAYRTALLTIIAKTNTYMHTPVIKGSEDTATLVTPEKLPSALAVATYAVTQLEDNPLFNSGHGAVFTRDGINELEASVMVSRGFAKRGVGVTGLRRVRNPILLARRMLEHGDADLSGKTDLGWASTSTTTTPDVGDMLDVPSAQGHTLVHGQTAETLARKYGLELVETDYFFTQNRWDEHMRALEREKQHKINGGEGDETILATWSPDEYLPQGTCGAVALDEEGVVCVATSTGGMTNKLTGRIGDTPIVGAGFWAEEWPEEDGYKMRQSASRGMGSDWSSRARQHLDAMSGPAVELSSSLRAMLADCLPTPFTYTPLDSSSLLSREYQSDNSEVLATRAAAISGTGNGDSFMRVNAVRTVAAAARWGKMPTSQALTEVAGRGGELQRSAGNRWGKTGEGEGGMIGIESIVTRHAESGRIVECKSEIVHDHNCAGMFRAWIDDEDQANFQIWHEKVPEVESLRGLIGEKA